MDHESEALQKLLLHLAGEGWENLPCSVESPPPENLSDPEALAIPSSDAGASDRGQSETFSSQRSYLLNLGDIPAVQDRFYRLLKNRLASEAQRTPPLFPWETEVHDYEAESTTPAVGSNLEGVGAPSRLWMTQLKNFGLPVALPEGLLLQLFHHCQTVAQSTLLEGAKLVQAVETLFPGEGYALNNLAGLVMTSPARSGEAPVVDYPPSYEAAAPTQQMVLSLLAAREILGALTLDVSTRQPTVTRQWLTEFGSLTLVADYHATDFQARLRVQGVLPGGGSLTLVTAGQQATATLTDAGQLSVELVVSPGQACTLEVRLGDEDLAPLVFAVRTDAA
jgi:hypothetical protein